MNDSEAILAANAEFYAAFTAGSIARMKKVWADDETISCIHPGWPPLIGHAAVIDSWREILRANERPQIDCVEPEGILEGDSARVICVEVVDGAPLAAANHFRRIDGRWRMVHHQSSPIAQLADMMGEDPSVSGGRVH